MSISKACKASLVTLPILTVLRYVFISAWEIVEDIDYDITGGRDGGYRGYTFKNNVKEGLWKVEVITNEELVLGVVDFKVVMGPSLSPKGLISRRF